jgi:hypothetical protein
MDDDETPDYPGILGNLGAQPGGLLGGLFPSPPPYPQQPAGLPPGADPTAISLAAAASATDLARTLRHIDHQTAIMAAFGKAMGVPGTASADALSQGAGRRLSGPVAASDASSADPTALRDTIAQASAAAPGIVSPSPPQSAVPPRPRPQSAPQWPPRWNPPISSLPSNPPGMPGMNGSTNPNWPIQSRWLWPETSALLHDTAGVPLPPPPNFPVLGKNQIDPNDLVWRIVRAESSGNPNAKNPSSSATGLAQFKNKTWVEQIKHYRPDLAAWWGSDEAIKAQRADPNLQQEMAARYAEENARALERAKFAVNDRNLYLAHHFGATGATDILSAENQDPYKLATDVLSDAAVRANPNVIGPTTTVRDLIQWSDDRMKFGPGKRQPSR